MWAEKRREGVQREGTFYGYLVLKSFSFLPLSLFPKASLMCFFIHPIKIYVGAIKESKGQIGRIQREMGAGKFRDSNPSLKVLGSNPDAQRRPRARGPSPS